LRQLVIQINKVEPEVICKAVTGKSLSDMRVDELAKAIWHSRSIARECPQVDRSKGEDWVREYPLDNKDIVIAVAKMVTGDIRWVTCVGFDTYKEAQEYKHYLLNVPYYWSDKPFEKRDKRLAEQVSVRKGEKTDKAWEVKIWKMDEQERQLIIFQRIQAQKRPLTKKEQNDILYNQLKENCDRLGLRFSNVDYLTFSAHIHDKNGTRLGTIGKRLMILSQPDLPFCVSLRSTSRDIPVRDFKGGLEFLMKAANIPLPSATPKAKPILATPITASLA
jgi:hypothetical protein